MDLVSRPDHAVSPFWRVFFKAPEVFLVYNFHKPAKTSIIVPKPYSFLVESDATFDTGGGWHVDWKSSSWVGQAMQFPCFEWFFFKVPEVFHVHNFHKPAKTSIIVPYSFFSGVRRNVWHRRRMKCGSKMDLVSRPDHAVSPFWRVFFQGPRGLPCVQLPQACQNQHYRTKTL